MHRGQTLVIILYPVVSFSRSKNIAAKTWGNLGGTQQESGQHKKTRGWWRWRWRGKPPLACSISACLNRPVRSRRLKQMQIALTCLQKKKKKKAEGFSNQLALTMVGSPEQGGCTVWALNGTMCERGAVKQRPGPSGLLSLSSVLYKADHHHDSDLLCNS